MDSGIENTLRVSEKRGQFSTEAAFEKRFCEVVTKKLDGKTFKGTGYKGMPDRFIFPNHFVEFKVNFFDHKIPIHKNWTTHQRHWAKDIHGYGGRSWYACLLQNKTTFKKYLYLEPAVWSLWAHENASYALSTYEKHLLVVPAGDAERFKDHIWERLETDYYEQSTSSIEKAGDDQSEHRIQRPAARLAP